MSCIPFYNAARHQYSVSAIYQVPVSPSLGAIEASATWSWIGSVYGSSVTHPDAEPGAWLNPIGLLNASARWDQILGTGMYMQLFGSNLLDKEYRVANSSVWNLLYYQSTIYGEPRMVGLRLGYRWG
jgi:iron complex outermembrane receptor protein